MIRILIVLLVACQHSDPPPSVQEPRDDPSAPRCVRAGGTCVGPAAVNANPTTPCRAGWHRVDDVSILGSGEPACYGIAFGEEACCMPDRKASP